MRGGAHARIRLPRSFREAFLLSHSGNRQSEIGNRRAVLLAICVLAACGEAPSNQATKQPSTAVVDDFGDTIRLTKPPTRIASLNPTTTEILFAIGAGDRLVGRTTYDHWPDSAKYVADLGAGIQPNVEAILAVKPDLVLLYASQDNRPAATKLREAGIATAAFKVDRIEQFDALTRLLGRIIGDSARGALVADTVRRTLDSVRALLRGAARPTVVLPVWDSPLLVIGGGSFMSQLVEIAGGRNVYDSLSAPSPSVAFEDIVRRDPDYVLVGPESAVRLRAQSKWRALRAVRSGKFLIVDTAVVLRPAVRLGEGAVSLARLLHPEIAK
jgi:ABC-type Fe3+-hydroxamate transport system substrate-binding protein